MPLDMVTPIMRSRAKAVNFVLFTESGIFTCEGYRCFNKEAKHYIESYLAHYSGVDSYMKNVVEGVR